MVPSGVVGVVQRGVRVVCVGRLEDEKEHPWVKVYPMEGNGGSKALVDVVIEEMGKMLVRWRWD